MAFFFLRLAVLALPMMLLLLAVPAMAAPVLRGDIVVADPIVTVGDMFEHAGLHAERALFRAPAPGTAGIVSLADIEAATRRAGIAFENPGWSNVRVARAGILIDEAAIGELISHDLEARGLLGPGVSAHISLSRTLPELQAEPVARPATLSALRYTPGSGLFSARLDIAGHARPLELSGRIELMVMAPHLAASLPAGTVLQPDDIEMRSIPLKYAENAGMPDIAALTGKALQRQTRAGTLLRPTDVAEPRLIGRNDIVTVVLRSGALTLTVRGQALNAAARGEAVSVLNLMSRKVVHGTATDAGTVEIPLAGTAEVAGL